MIELIDKGDFSPTSIGNPEISFQRIEDRNANLGELASLVVDLILERANLVDADTFSSTGFLFGRQTSIMYATSSGLIHKKSFFADFGVPITKRQLKKIKRIYEKWWKSNK